jgi:GH25 family lysozyme M1 (1,4-beta-N-acetylmuramidase)
MTIFGPDFSHYDAIPNVEKIVSEGFSFFTHKAGGDANDGEIAGWWSAVKPYRSKLLLGAYWVLYPGNPAARADAFISRLDATCPGWRDGPFILQVDCEKWNNDSSTAPEKADIRAFCDRLRQRAPKLLPIVYAPNWYYADRLAGLPYPLWASSYVSGAGAASALYPGDGSSKWHSYSGQTPAILQFTSSATIAGQTTCDANAFRGTLNELTALVAPRWAEDMALTDDDVAKTARAVISAMQTVDGIISGPSTAASVLDGTNPTWTVGGFLRDSGDRERDILKKLDTVLTALKAPVQIDVQALAAAIVAALPSQPGAALTSADVENALRNVLHNA